MVLVGKLRKTSVGAVIEEEWTLVMINLLAPGATMGRLVLRASSFELRGRPILASTEGS